MAAKRGGKKEDGGQRDERGGGGRTGRGGHARLQQQTMEKMVETGTRAKGARGMAAGWGVGNPALRESAPRWGACDWPRVAMVAWAAFTEIHCSHWICVEVADHGARVECLSCMSSMFVCVEVYHTPRAPRKLIHKCCTHCFLQGIV